MKKINRRSFLAACGVAAAAAALTACGGSSSSSTAASTAASQAGSAASGSGSADFSGRTLTVGIWGGNDQETAAINQLKDNFEADHGCTVELKVYTPRLLLHRRRHVPLLRLAGRHGPPRPRRV